MKVARAQRCVHHSAREAVARCPGCARFFCRECVSEHDDRVLCARCLARVQSEHVEKSSRFAQVFRLVGVALGLAVTWWFFDLAGRGLIRLPASVHEGTVWEKLTESE